MPEALFSLDGWLLRTTLAGGIVLFIGSVWMLLTRQPVQRQKIGESALLAALLVALPAALPAWWSLPGTESSSATNRAIFTSSLTDNPNDKPAKPEKNDGTFAASLDLNNEEDAELFEIVGLLQTLPQNDTVDGSKQDGSVLYQEVPPSECEPAKCKTKGMTIPLSIQIWTWTMRGIGLTYLTLVAVLLIRCSIGYYGLWRYWRNRRPAPAHVHTALAELEPDPALRPRIGVNALVHGPVSYGLWKPTILLPPHFCNEGDPEKLRWILAHELTHLRRRDAWGCLLLAIGGAFYFHVPWYWWMKRHVRLAQEYLADAAAVKFANAVEYAQYLVSLTTCSSRPTLASSQAAGVFETPSDLYRRVHMLLHQRSVLERGTPRWWTVTAAASFLALATCTAGMKLQAVEPDVQVAIAAQAVDDEQTDDRKSSDIKQERKVKVIVDGKEIKGDDKNVIVLQGDDKGEGKQMLRLRLEGMEDKQKKIEEALKKLDQALETLPKQLDAETKSRLEEVKKTLKSMKENQQVYLFKAVEDAKGEAAKHRERLIELSKNIEVHKDEIKKNLEQELKRARDSASAAEKQAKLAQEKALTRWKEAKSGDDRDAAIKELEKAIAEKEKALKSLKDGSTKRAELVVRAAPSASKGRLGVMVATIDPTLRSHLDIGDDQGLLIQNVVENSPAWNNGKGLKNGDILLNLGGKSISSSPEKFVELVKALKEGTHSATVLRKGKKVNIQGIKIPGEQKSSDDDAKPATALSPIELHVAPALDGKLDHLTLVPRNIQAIQGELNFNPVVVSELRTVKPALIHAVDGNLKLQPMVDGKGLLSLKPELAVGKPINIAGDVKKVQVVDAATEFDPQGIATKPRLGVILEQVPEAVANQVELAEDRGLLVKEVVEGSAAQKAGFLKNDILIEFADKPVTRDHPAFSERVKSLKPGKYTATVIRKGKELRLRDINLTELKNADDERRAKAKEWMVEGEKEKDVAKADGRKDKDGLAKKKDDFFPNARPNFNFGRQQGNTSISINNGKFTATSTNDDKTITVVGQIVNGKAQPSSITIKNEDTEKKYKTLKEVPEEDRAEVEKLLNSFRGNAFMLRGNEFNAGAFNEAFEQHMKQLEKQLKEMGIDNPGFDQMEKQMQELRKQLQRLRQNRLNDDDDHQS